MSLSTVLSLVLHLLSSRQSRKDKIEITSGIDKVISAIKNSENALRKEIRKNIVSKLKVLTLYDRFVGGYIEFLKEFQDNAINESKIKDKLFSDLDKFGKSLIAKLRKEGRKNSSKEETKQFKKLWRNIIEKEKEFCRKEEIFLNIQHRLNRMATFVTIGTPYIDIIVDNCKNRIMMRKERIGILEKKLRGFR